MSQQADEIQQSIETQLNNLLITQAIGGCGIRELYLGGEEELAHQIISPAHAKIAMELTHFIEQSIRDGSSISDAVFAAKKAGYVNKLMEVMDI